MKKKILALIMSVCMVFGLSVSFGACEITETFDKVLELEELKSYVEELEEENSILKSEVATLKFESKFPNGLVTESCTLKDVKVNRTEVNTEGSVYAIRANGPEVEVTINGGVYCAGEGSLYNIAVWAHNNSKIIINDGYFSSGKDVNGEFNHVVYAAGGSTIEINGGWFESYYGSDPTWLLNCQDNNGTIVVKGGTFVDFDPSNCISEGEGTNFVAEGYVVVKEIKEGATYYTVVEATEAEDDIEVSSEEPLEF